MFLYHECIDFLKKTGKPESTRMSVFLKTNYKFLVIYTYDLSLISSNYDW